MFASWYLSHNAQGVERLFLFTLCCAVAYFLGCLIYKHGRTFPAIKRAAIVFVVADVITELVYYLSYMAYFPGYEVMDVPARMIPGAIFPVIFFGASWLLVKVMNDMVK